MSLARYSTIAERSLQLSDHPANGLGQPLHEAHPAPHWQQYFSKSSNDLISRYANSSPWSPSTTNWPENTALSSDFRAVDTGPRPSTLGLATHGQYPESSQRTSLPSLSSSQTFAPSQPLSSNLPLSTSFERAASKLAPAPTKLSEVWGTDLYTIDDGESLCPPSRNNTSTPSVKQEPDDSDDGFIMEFSNSASSPAFENSLAPPTEVPLRATQASKEMRKMMGVFRLNPFTMHNAGSHGMPMPSWNGEAAGPLEEEPQLYEFQLLVDGELESDEELRSFSPDFEIGSAESDCAPPNEWARYHARRMPRSSSRRPSVWDHSSTQIYASPTGTSASLELEYPDSSTDQQQGSSFSLRYPLNSYAPQHEFPTSASPSYTSSSSSSEMTRMRHRDAVPEQTWNDYLCHPRPSSSVDASELVARHPHSMTSDTGSTPYSQAGSALSMSAARRWSLPSQGPFLV